MKVGSRVCALPHGLFTRERHAVHVPKCTHASTVHSKYAACTPRVCMCTCDMRMAPVHLQGVAWWRAARVGGADADSMTAFEQLPAYAVIRAQVRNKEPVASSYTCQLEQLLSIHACGAPKARAVKIGFRSLHLALNPCWVSEHICTGLATCPVRHWADELMPDGLCFEICVHTQPSQVNIPLACSVAHRTALSVILAHSNISSCYHAVCKTAKLSLRCVSCRACLPGSAQASPHLSAQQHYVPSTRPSRHWQKGAVMAAKKRPACLQSCLAQVCSCANYLSAEGTLLRHLVRI